MRSHTRPVILAASLLSAGAAAGTALGTSGALARDRAPPPVFRLDEDFTIRVASKVRPAQVDAGTVRIRTASGAEARGTLVAGTFLADRVHDRRVVVRPEAVREYFQIVRGLDRAGAERMARRTLARLETTGDLRPLDRIDSELRDAFGPSSGAGVRLDDPAVSAVVPAHGTTGGAAGALRSLVAGDDARWDAYVAGPDVNAFAELEANPDWERFHHAADPDSATRDTASVYRRREHRRVVFRRSARTITFAPAVPVRADLADAAYATGETYLVALHRPLGAGRALRSALSAAPVPFRRGAAVFATGGDGDDFAAPEIPAAARGAGPRVVSVTPPDGETVVDPTTDWEDPDNAYAVPIFARRTFTVRLRFAHPIHPADATPQNFTLTRVARAVGTPGETTVAEPLAAGVFLVQRRLGDVVVEVVPQFNPDPASRYEVRVASGVRNLSGEPSALPFVATFTTR